MTTHVAAGRSRINVVAVVLCCLAGTLPHGHMDAPGIAIAAEKQETPTTQTGSGDPAKDTPAEPSNNGEDPAPGDEPAKADADESEEVFVPSEHISEDIDVPFPVDI